MGTLLDWFRTRREAKIIKGTRSHSKKVYDCAFELNNIVKLLCNNNIEEVPKLVKKISDLENEADEIRRTIMLDLTKGELTPGIREDLAHLVKRLDSVANNTNATARRLSLLTADVITPICKELKEMSKLTLKCVKVLDQTIGKQLGGSSPKIFESIAKINQLEHEVDQINMQIKKKLLTLEQTFSPFIACTIYEMINVFENITDNAEETAEFIKVINVRQ
ncbi:MAG: TIGR00153 family protein [Candidatus Helarchaeota archaeon]|nr:TIGR00153 family protein [Candidatus Helarchaeota archaeon]